MKRLTITITIISAFMLSALTVFGQDNITSFSAYWKDKASLFKILPNPKNEICFLGDSITDGCEWAELTGKSNATNRGIGGDTAWGIIARIDEITQGKPSKVFLMIGTNDLSRGKTPTEVSDKIDEIIKTIKKQSPQTVIYLQSTFPVIDGKVKAYENKNINPLNIELEKIAKIEKVTWIEIASSLKDKNGQLKSELTNDGLHLNGAGYQLWYSLIKKYLD